jgi:hypothetical protein
MCNIEVKNEKNGMNICKRGTVLEVTSRKRKGESRG